MFDIRKNARIARELTALAIPLLLGSLLQQLYNAIDAMVIGRCVDQTAFAAIGIAASAMNLFLFLLNGICNGLSVLYARIYGEGDRAAMRRESFISFCFGLGVTLLLACIGLGALQPLLRAIRTPEQAFEYVRTYLTIVFAALPVTFFYNWEAALLRAAGRMRAALIALCIALAVNLALDIAFVAMLGLGVAGAALATALAQALSALICYGTMRRRAPDLLFGRDDMRMDARMLGETARYGIISALHQSSLYIGKLLIQGTVNACGTEMVAAYTAATRIEAFANSFGDSGSSAVSIYTGQRLGAKRYEDVQRGFKTALGLMIGLSAGLALIMFFGARPLSALLMGKATSPSLDAAQGYLRAVAPFYILCFIGNVFVGYFRGVGMVNIPAIGTAMHIALRVLLSERLMGALGLPAVALATGAGWALVVAFQCAVYHLSRRAQSHSSMSVNMP